MEKKRLAKQGMLNSLEKRPVMETVGGTTRFLIGTQTSGDVEYLRMSAQMWNIITIQYITWKPRTVTAT